MNFRQLDCFLAVAEQSSISSAAEKLFLSQSAVSQQIAALETELGFPLFVRDKHGTTLTPAGEYLYTRLIRFKEEYSEALQEAGTIAATGKEAIVLGYDGPLAEAWFGSAVQRFHHDYPSIEIEMHKEPAAKLLDMLDRGSLDVIVTYLVKTPQPEGIRFRPLSSGGCCLYVPRNHRLAGRDSAGLADIDGEKLITSYRTDAGDTISRAAQMLEAAGVDLTAARYVEDGDTAFSMVEAGLGIFIASHLCDAFARRYDVKAIDFDIDVSPAVMGLAWKEDDPLIEEFCSYIEKIARA